MEKHKLVIEHQGWLLKRGAGYKPPSNSSKATRTSNKSFNSANNQTRINSAPFRVVGNWGNQERSRFFRLMRHPTEEYAELVYYKNDPRKSRAKFKGRVILRPHNIVKLTEDCEILLITQGRTYYLRPDVDIFRNDTEALTIATQWEHALQKCIKRLRPKVNAIESQVSSSSGNLGRKRANSDDDNVSISSVRDVNYKDVWDAGKFEAYLKIVEHFGPVQSDSTKLVSFLENRVAQLASRLRVMSDFAKRASGPVIKHQPTTYKALQALHEQDKRRRMTMELVFDNFSKARNELVKKLQDNREKVLQAINMHPVIVTQLKEMRKTVKRAKQDINQKKRRLSMIGSEMSARSNSDLGRLARKRSFVAGISSNITGLSRLLSRVKDRLKTSNSENEVDDPEELAEEIKIAVQTYKQLKGRYISMEKQAGPALEQILAKLQMLEEERIKIQTECIAKTVSIDQGLYAALYSHCNIDSATKNNVGKFVEKIDGDEDMKSITAELLSIAARASKR